MRSTKVHAGLSALLALTCLAAGCGNNKDAARGARQYALLGASTIHLYSQIQPLRSSRLGLVRSDSLLFTFSDDEIARSIKRLRKLEAQFSDLSASNLPPREVAEAVVIVHWLRGELFSFETLRNHASNPLLYTWLAEEALWGMPARVAPPYDGELEAYRKRIRRIPLLLQNGKRHLANPAEPLARYAIERVDTLLGGLGTLDGVVATRYGTSLGGDLEPVRTALVDFRKVVSDLLPSAHGTLILGTENLSKVFLYEELLNADPNVLVAEAENQIKRLDGEVASLELRGEFERERRTKPGAPARMRLPGDASPAPGAERKPAPPSHAAATAKAPGTRHLPGETIVSRIERLSLDLLGQGDEESGIGRRGGAKPILEYPAWVEYLMPFGKNPYLAMPPLGEHRRSTAFVPPLSAPACRSYLCLSRENAGATDTELELSLLRAVSGILEAGKIRCEQRDSLGALFSSETFAEGWRYLTLLERGREIRKKNPDLYSLLLQERKKDLARMIIVFKLHAGSLTFDEATRYLVGTMGMNRDAASREVLLASASPSIAWPGISMMLIEEMLKNTTFVFGSDQPNRSLAKLLLEWRDVPLAFVVPKTKSD